VSWKRDLKLSDLESPQRIEITCRRCGKSRYETAGELLARRGFRSLYIDEAEHALTCRDRFCRGRVRVALVHEGKVEGFIGGMA
jgi:ribosomal protein L37E